MSEITFFSSPIGLGHATRDSAVANCLDNIATKFVSGSGAVQFLNQCGFNVIDAYTPPSFDVQKGSMQHSLKWLWKYYKYYKECKKISSEIIKSEKPKLVVSDEDFASLSIAQKQNLPTVLITDILETKFTKGFGSLIEKRMNKSMKNIMKKCRVVILPEDGDNDENLRRVGPIVRTTSFSRDELRTKFSFNKKTIIVTAGGTKAGEFLIQKTVNCFKKLNDDEVELIIVSGPSLNKKYSNSIRNFGFVNNLHEMIFAADLVISLAGKSTIDECKAYGTPGIFIPLKQHFEQEDNAKEEGCYYNDINRLHYLISKKLSSKRNPERYQGAQKAAEIIKTIIEN